MHLSLTQKIDVGTVIPSTNSKQEEKAMPAVDITNQLMKDAWDLAFADAQESGNSNPEKAADAAVARLIDELENTPAA